MTSTSVSVSDRPAQRRLFYRPGEVATMTGISLSVVYRAIESGELAAHRFGRRALVILPDDMDAWVASMLSPVDGEGGE